MRYGIISDIHGNLEALETVQKALSGEKVDKVLCVGDMVGYGADPAECIKQTKALSEVIVCGNHDAATAGVKSMAFFNEAARNAVIWTQKNLSDKDKDFLKSLDLVYKNEHLTLVHGTLQEPGEFHYMFDKGVADATFKLMETPVTFVGPSHVPGIFSKKKGSLNYFYKEKVKLSRGESLIINVGSVGQPRDGDPRLCYSVYDTSKNLIELKRLSYDIKKAQRKILDARIPTFLAYRLSEGV